MRRSSEPSGDAGPSEKKPEGSPVLEARLRLERLTNVLASLMFGEPKGLTQAQQRWVEAARSKMTPAELAALPTMRVDDIYPLAKVLHERVQADPQTKYEPSEDGLGRFAA